MDGNLVFKYRSARLIYMGLVAASLALSVNLKPHDVLPALNP